MSRDVAGRELVVGQRVAYCLAGTSQVMRVAKVLKVNPKTVSLDTVMDAFSLPLTRLHAAVCIVPDETQEEGHY